MGIGDSITNYLQNAGLTFEANVSLEGVLTDFVVYAPDGRRFAIDVKSWEKRPGFTNHAAHQVVLYEESLGVDRAFIVVEGLERSRPADGVLTIDRLIPMLQQELQVSGEPKQPVRSVSEDEEPLIFAGMPFGREYDDTYFVAMAPAASAVEAVCKRVDQEIYTGDVMDRITMMIRSSAAVIVDLSEGHPNVLYEAGYAHALEKPVIHICSTPVNELPFDVSHWNTIKYYKGGTYHLRQNLTRTLRVVLR